MRSNDKGDQYARTIEGSPHKFHIFVSSLFIEQDWGSAHRCLCVRRGGEYTSPKNDIHLAWKSIGVCFIVGLMIWNTVTGFFTRFFFLFFLLWKYDTKYIWKVIQFFPLAGNIYDDIIIRGRLLCNSCGWRWNLLRIFDIESVNKRRVSEWN